MAGKQIKIKTFLLLSALAALSCGKDSPAQTKPPVRRSVVPTAEARMFGIDTNYYEKYVSLSDGADSIPIVAAAKVSDEAMEKARIVCRVLTATLPKGALFELRRQRVYLAIFGNTEYPDALPGWPAGIDAKRYGGGFGPAPNYRACGIHEGDILRNQYDRYKTENIVVHEFGHAIKNYALELLIPGFKKRVQTLYETATASGKWANTYAGSNADEYWAECVQSYFDLNAPGPVNGDGIHNNIYTRSALQSYDQEMYALLEEVYNGITLPKGDW
jgi:hypothetical protein